MDDVTRRPKRAETWSGIEAQRVKELIRLFRSRWGYVLPDDDAGRDDAEIYLDHAVKLKGAQKLSANFLTVWCPWKPPEERDLSIGFATRNRRWWGAAELGDRLGLTEMLRMQCNIKTFRAQGMDDLEMEHRRKEAMRVWERLFRGLAARGRSTEMQMIDATYVKAHRSAWRQEVAPARIVALCCSRPFV